MSFFRKKKRVKDQPPVKSMNDRIKDLEDNYNHLFKLVNQHLCPHNVTEMDEYGYSYPFKVERCTSCGKIIKYFKDLKEVHEYELEIKEKECEELRKQIKLWSKEDNVL